jgi:hypothetical protein
MNEDVNIFSLIFIDNIHVLHFFGFCLQLSFMFLWFLLAMFQFHIYKFQNEMDYNKMCGRFMFVDNGLEF